MNTYYEMFKSYDIRGTYPNISTELYYCIGQALVEFFITQGISTTINICRDARYTGAEFYKALYNGILDAGGHPVCLGIASTDYLYSACQSSLTPGAIITASHNPKDDNGLKVVKEGAQMLGLKEGLATVRDIALAKIENQDIDQSKWKEPIENHDLKEKFLNDFIEKIKSIGKIDEINNLLVTKGQKLRIAVDAGNGMGGWIMNFFKDLYTNIEFVPMYWELDGTFPNHPANPTEYENLTDLINKVRDNDDIDFGFAFDGDGDRVYFIDNKAEIVDGDFLVAFLARNLISEYYKNPDPSLEPAVVFIEPGSRCVVEAITESSAVAIPSTQGHTGIKLKMAKHKAVYGGEYSGHHYYGSFGNQDSGVITAALMIKILVESGKQISELFLPLQQSYFISELINIKLPQDITYHDVESRVREYFIDANFASMDGISVFYPDWKFNMRPSNTEPVVRFKLETRFTNTLSEKLNLVRKVIGIDF